MTSFASLGALIVLALAPPEGSRSSMDPLEVRVVEEIARAWDVPAGSIELAWGRRPPPGSVDAAAPLRVTGRGVGGWFVAVTGDAGRAASAVRVRAGVRDSVPVASRPLAAGTTLVRDDVRLEPRVHWGPPAGRTEQPGAGWMVRRAMASGEALVQPAVSPPPLIAAGEPVRLVWERGVVTVTVLGTAMRAARNGEVVRARLEGRPGRLSAIAISPGNAKLRDGGGP